MKRIIAVLLVLAMLFALAGCGNGAEETSGEVSGDTSEVSKPEKPKEPVYLVNPLTGLKDLDEGKGNVRPVAIMINNIKVAQTVQTAVQKADIIYETEVEGGITRLMAVYKDISKVPQVGTVRSARYVYIDLALGLDAIYVHAGRDPEYALQHLRNSGIDAFDINTNPYAAYGFREKNGLSSEHTLYTTGEKLNEGFEKLGVRTTTERTENFYKFSDTPVKFAADKVANTVKVKFSGGFTSTFVYDAAKGIYSKYQEGVGQTLDSKTGESYDVKNVFILSTSIQNYPDGKHRNVSLSGGAGWYVTNGTYTPITWKKSAENKPFEFFSADGVQIAVNPGKSWVCIENDNFAPTFE